MVCNSVAFISFSCFTLSYLFHQKWETRNIKIGAWVYLKSLREILLYSHKDQGSMLSYVDKSPTGTCFQGRYIAVSSRGLHRLRACQPSSLETLSSVIKCTFTHWERLKSTWLMYCLFLSRILMGSTWQTKQL